MQVKGMTIIARRELLTRMFGQKRWDDFIAIVAKKDPSFEDRIFVTSRISLESFLFFNEKLIDTFFDGDVLAYSLIGSKAAEWVFTESPYKAVMERGKEGLAEFVASVPLEMWDKYYDFGKLELKVMDNEIEVKISGLPIRHPYFELTVSGFMTKSVELAGLLSPTVSVKQTNEDSVVLFSVKHQGWKHTSKLDEMASASN